MAASDLQPGMAYMVNSVTHSELRPLVQPADGDDYTYSPRRRDRAPLIPAQWVSVGQYHNLVAEVERLRNRVAELEKLTGQWQGD